MARFVSQLTITLAILIVSAILAEAKRAAPHPVEPVVIGPVKYSAPLDPDVMGFIIATDTRSGKELWRQQIYQVSINPARETDVQWIFITSLTRRHNSLLITNERGERFALSLKTRKVTKLE